MDDHNMTTAFLFPGQGAQSLGMGKDIAEALPVAAQIFQKANDILGFDLQKICFEGPAEKLNSTVFSQPAIFTTSAAILEVLRTSEKTKALKPDITAGLSLGEYTALYAAGVISFADALVLVQKRGRAMQAAADATEGAMLSIIGLEEDKVKQLCAEAAGGELLEPVNFNCPGQIVVSGSKSACKRAEQLAADYGAIKAVPLVVAGAFHTEMIAAAAENLAQTLKNCHITDPSDVKIIANIDADYYQSGQKIAQGLTKQLTCPILWQKCMEKLLAEKVTNYYEIGPGRVLTGLMRRIDRKTKVINVSSLRAINELLKS
jgi:[acyl-carrier-protein] S-malonyltransferase